MMRKPAVKILTLIFDLNFDLNFDSNFDSNFWLKFLTHIFDSNFWIKFFTQIIDWLSLKSITQILDLQIKNKFTLL